MIFVNYCGCNCTHCIYFDGAPNTHGPVKQPEEEEEAFPDQSTSHTVVSIHYKEAAGK